MSCALRALTLCDGSSLETAPDELTGCLCEALRRADLYGSTQRGRDIAERRRRLIEETMLEPLPLTLP